GNNILTVLDTLQGVREYCIRGKKPYLVECMTFRLRGHEEASGTKYVPPALFEEWAAKDPVSGFERYLTASGVLDVAAVEQVRGEIRLYIEEELRLAGSGEDRV